MAFFAGLLTISALLWSLGYFCGVTTLRNLSFVARLAAAVMFCFIGLSHVIKPHMLTYMVEGLLPHAQMVVYSTGLLEIVLGLGLLYPPTQRACAWGLLILLVAVFPANVNVALNHLPPPGGLPAKPWYVWSRLAFQPLYMVWIWFAALANKP